jgi:hypothetical protein
MRIKLAFSAVALVVAVACTQAPTAPDGGVGGAPGPLMTVVDVPISVAVTEGLVGTWNYVGQSVTIPAGSDVGDVRFAWYHYNPRGEATAFGRIYVLDRAYFGLPGDLSPSTPGFLARSEPQPVSTNNAPGTQGSEYELPSSLVLKGGAKYWFYTDAKGAFATSFDQDIYAGGQMFHTGYHALAFYESKASGRMVNGVFVPAPVGVTTDANFRLRGSAR